ncbi:lipid asymmetry maintenance protein MlaB [Pseudoduganella sp. UC29_71]|jgi:anti-anti-sigma factor|uniref:STAS domain-containing protein n=1 Tax=Pseudoduganella sp. UC29_71 TaxID=3350174 RepID=UPI003672D28C
MPGDTDQGLLFIEGELTIYRAAELKDALLAAVNHSPVLEVDLAGVTDIDTAGVQLLMLAKRSALQLQRQVRLVSHSPAVLEVFELLDLGAWFGDPLLMAADTASGSAA